MDKEDNTEKETAEKPAPKPKQSKTPPVDKDALKKLALPKEQLCYIQGVQFTYLIPPFLARLVRNWVIKLGDPLSFTSSRATFYALSI